MPGPWRRFPLFWRSARFGPGAVCCKSEGNEGWNPSRFQPRLAGGFRVEVTHLGLPAERGVNVLFGPSGSGKSTVRPPFGLWSGPTPGTIGFGEEIWSDTTRRVFIGPSSRRIGFVFRKVRPFPHRASRAT